MVNKNIINGITATDIEHFSFLYSVNMGYVCAMIVHTNAIQVLPELLMDQFDTLRSQWKHIEHTHEGVLSKSNYY